MGRPINKKYLGNTSTSGQQLQATAYFGNDSQTRTAWINSQKGTGKYFMTDVAGTGNCGKVSLVDGNTSLAQGQANVSVTPFGASGSGATASANLGIATVTVVSGGNGPVSAGYVPGQVLYPSSGTYSIQGNVIVNSVTLGNVSVYSNNGYTVGDTFTWNYTGFNTPVVLTVATVSGNGNISGLTYTSAGSVSNINISNTTPYSTSTTANAWATSASFTIRWDVSQLSVLHAGDFSSAPANPVALTGSAHGTNANATVTWLVSSVQVTAGGVGYQAASVTFGTGLATASASVNGAGNVSVITVTSPEGPYTHTAPTVTVSPIKSVEYAKVIKNKTVETFEGNSYEWVDSATTPVDGQAQLQTA